MVRKRSSVRNVPAKARFALCTSYARQCRAGIRGGIILFEREGKTDKECVSNKHVLTSSHENMVHPRDKVRLARTDNTSTRDTRADGCNKSTERIHGVPPGDVCSCRSAAAPSPRCSIGSCCEASATAAASALSGRLEASLCE